MDARISCPVCGQQIHPVAGRCKFCKTDLVKLREQRGFRPPRVDGGVIAGKIDGSPDGSPTAAPAPAPTPFSEPAPALMPGPAPAPTNGTNGHNGHTLEAATYAYTPEAARPSIVRRWPILVAIVAGIAIVVCLYLLFFAGDDKRPKHTTTSSHSTQPAPDRMPQAPTPQPPGSSGGHLPDPWGQGTSPNTPQLPPNFDDPPLPTDPVPDPTPDPQANNGAAPGAEKFLDTVDQTITKFASCTWGTQSGNTGVNVDFGQLFGQLFGSTGFTDQAREMIRNGRCTYDEPKGEACIKALASFDCSAGGTLDFDKLGPMVFELDNCMSALSCQ